MDIEKIKETINNDSIPNHSKEFIIMGILAKDKKVIPKILELLELERKENNELILDSNLELSRALVTIEDENIGTKKAYIEKDFVIGEIKKHYLRWQHKIKCCFKIKDLP